MDGVSATPAVIHVGDHVRWAAPDFDVNIVWEVTKATRKSFYLRCDVEQDGETRTKRHRAQREDCTLVAHQLMLTDAPPARAGATTR